MDVKRLALTVIAVALLAACGGGRHDEDPGERACRYVAAGSLPDDPAAVGRMAAGSGVPALASAGARLRDAGSVAEMAAASARLARACRARSVR